MSREVPEGWRAGKFDTFITLQRGFDLPVQDRQRGNFAVIASNGQIDSHSEARILGPAVVTGRSGTLGKVFYISQGCWPLNTTLYVRDFHGNDPEFVAWFLKHFGLERFGTGTGVPTLNRNVVHEVEVAFPPLHEQRRIAEILSSVDGAIAATRAVIEQTRKVKQGVLDRLLTKGIGHTRLKQTEIGEIPEGWTVATLAEAGVAILDGDRGKEYPKAEDYQEEGYCLFLSAKNVTRSGFVFDECQFLSEEKHLKLRNGVLQRSDIVVTTRGTIGNFAFYGPDIEFDCLRINSGMALMRSIRSQIHPHLLFAITASELIEDQLKRRVFGSAQPQLTLDILRKLVVPVPPEAEQVSIAAQANDLLEIERHQRVQLTAIERFKSALMSDLLTGRKRVTDALPMAAE